MAKHFFRKASKTILICCNIAVAIFLLIGCYGSWMNQDQFWFTGLFTLACFYFLLLLIAFLVFWIFVKPGTDKDAFATAAMAAKATDYIPAGFEESIIAHTGLTGGGETVTIEFPAPAKGFYSFFCSFPGRYMSMKGTFYVN